MNSESGPEAIDTRWVFRGYAVLAGLAGLLLLGWGPMWLGTDLAGQPWGKAALIRVLGAILIAAACCAAGFAAVDHPAARGRGLFWFAIGHFILFQVVLAQQSAVWGPGLRERIVLTLGSASLVLWTVYLWTASEKDGREGSLITLFSGAGQDAATQWRSQYERQIREAARQEERNRLARDLHDSIKQQIFVVQTAAATAQTRSDNDPGGTREALEQVRSSAREAMIEMQAMLDQLHAVPLENAGLIESLKKQCEALGFRTGAKVEFKLGDLPSTQALPPGGHEAILRVAQEALANIGRHARAANVEVALGSVGKQVELRIRDDGAGFDPNRDVRGQGIANMRARAAEFSGTFELTSQPSQGTSVTFSIPCAPDVTLKEYRRRAALLGVFLAIMLPFVFWVKSWAISGLTTVFLIGAVRYVVVYRRARTQSGAIR